MSTTIFSTPILLIVFNRPVPTQIVLEHIKTMRPTKLFIAADGPRNDMPTDSARCAKVREIVSIIDWECDVHTLFRDKNLGCGLGPSLAISWFFENVEEGIILEDDCLPSQSFFKFCETLLEYYRNVPQIMHISGDNFQYGRKRGKGSYYFSHYTHNWGWATWRRAWKYFDFNLIPEEIRSHVWDQQWELSVEKNNGVAILPNKNLVKNIGFGKDATHTTTMGKYSYLDAEDIKFPLSHPKRISVHKTADEYTMYTHFLNVNPKMIWRYKCRNILSNAGSRAEKVFRRIFELRRDKI